MSVELGKGKDLRSLSTQKVIWHRADWAEGKNKKSKVRKGRPMGIHGERFRVSIRKLTNVQFQEVIDMVGQFL